MSVLRYIDGEGREGVVDDVNHLFELIKSRQIQSTNLVWDEGESRWISARDHEFFRRIREMAADIDLSKPSVVAAESSAAHVYGASSTAYKPASSEARNNKEPSQASREHGSRANVSEKPKARWFKPIKSREEALKTVKATSAIFFTVAGIQAIILLPLAAKFSESVFDLSWFAIGLIDPGLYVALASWLRWGRSFEAAVLLLLAALISFGAKTLAMPENGSGGINIWLMSLIVFWTACKAVEATLKLPEYEKASAQEEYQ
jgi:hypothetical protein